MRKYTKCPICGGISELDCKCNWLIDEDTETGGPDEMGIYYGAD